MPCPGGIIADGATSGGLVCVNGQPDISSTGFWFESPAAHLDHLAKNVVPAYRDYISIAVTREANTDQRSLPRHLNLLNGISLQAGSLLDAANASELALRASRAGQLLVHSNNDVSIWGAFGTPVPFPPIVQDSLSGLLIYNSNTTLFFDENGEPQLGLSSSKPSGAYKILEQRGVLGPLLTDALRGAVPRLWWLYLTSARELLLD